MFKRVRWGFVLLFVWTGFSFAEKTAIDLEQFTQLYYKKKDLNEATSQYRQMESLRAEAQKSLERLLKKSPNNLELKLRYGELLLQRARDMEHFVLELEYYNENAEVSKLKSTIQTLYKSGLSIHKNLLPRMKKHPLEANVYLGLARTENGLKNPKASYDILNKAQEIKNIPPNTEMQIWLLRGDVAFQLKKLSESLKSFEKSLALASSNTVEEAYIQYKLAWTEYNLSNPSAAIAYLRKVIDSNKDKYALGQEAVQDFSLFAVDLSSDEFHSQGGLSGVYKYLKKASNSETARKAYDSMALVFSENGKRERGIKTLEFLIEKFPKDFKNAERALNVVHWSHDLVNKVDLTKRYYWLLENFAPKSKWYKQQTLRPDVQRNSKDSIEESLRTFAVGLHKEAEKEKATKRKEMLESSVAKLYDAHIEAFSEFPRINFYRAEIHRRHQEWRQAAEHYDDFVRLISNYEAKDIEPVDIQFKEEAALSSVQMWAKTVEKKPKLADKMISASDTFLKLYPQHKLAAQVALDSAKIDLASGNIETALNKVNDLVNKYPKTQQAVEAVHAGLDILNKEADFINLATSARVWIDKVDQWAPAKSKSKVSKELKGILSSTEAKACEALSKKSGEELEAALCFQRFATGFEKDPLAPKALLLSSELFEKYGDHLSSLESLERLVNLYPKSEYAGKGYSQLATTYEKNYQFKKAANIYENLLKRKDTPDKNTIVARLLEILFGTKQTKKLTYWLENSLTTQSLKNEILSRSWYKDFLDIRLEERRLGYKSGRFVSSKAQKLYENLVSTQKSSPLPEDLQLELTRIKGHFIKSKGDLAQADKIWMAGMKRFWKMKGKTPQHWEAAARLRLSQGSYWMSVFQRADIEKNPQKKVALFQKVEAWNAEVINLKSPKVALESLWETSKLYNSFGQDLLNMNGTEDMGRDMLKKSDDLIKEIARRAKNWNIISPVLLDALKHIRQNALEDPAESVEIGLNFPWMELPRWIDANTKEAAWSEWLWKTKKLKAVLENKKETRSKQKRAALVYLIRGNNLKENEIARWSKLLTSKIGVQARIQALINQGEFELAELFLSQYENLLGVDSFAQHFRGKIEWGRGDYSLAYQRWISASNSDDFRSRYFAAGWTALFEELVEGTVQEKGKRFLFKQVAPYAKKSWEKQLVATLCLGEVLSCEFPYKGFDLTAIISKEPMNYQKWEYPDGNSVWNIRKNSMELLLSKLGPIAPNYKKYSELRNILSQYYKLGSYSLDWKSQKSRYGELKKILSKRESELDSESKARALATTQKKGKEGISR